MNRAINRFIAVGSMAVASLAMAAEPGSAEKSAAKSAVDIKKLVEDFSKKRDVMLADRQKLVDQLKGATEEQRKAILEQLQQQQKDLTDAMRELGKQQRDEARRLRESTAKPGGR